jgi:hypothetical protein
VQAAAGLAAWRSLDGGAELVVEDDGSDPARLTAAIATLAARCDLLLGPYSTQLMRSAARALADRDCLVWNHGGAGDDVCAMLPGRIVSVLTPAGRYAEPFLRRLADSAAPVPLWIVAGPGSFGRQVAAGAESRGRTLGLEVVSSSAPNSDAEWDLLSCGAFEDDVATIRHALASRRPPRLACSVAAGVRDFAGAVARPDGVFGIAQWFPGTSGGAELGPDGTRFVTALGGVFPDYPAVQAAAAAVVAAHCARLAGGTSPRALWSAAAGLDTSTLFGRFRIDAVTGVQLAHDTVLVRWTGREVRACR